MHNRFSKSVFERKEELRRRRRRRRNRLITYQKCTLFLLGVKKRRSYIRRHRKRSRPARLLQPVLSVLPKLDAYRVVALASSVSCTSLTTACACSSPFSVAPSYVHRDGERRHEGHLDQAVLHSSWVALKPPSVQCCVTSTEIESYGLSVRDGEPAAGTATLIFTQLLSSDRMRCLCFSLHYFDHGLRAAESLGRGGESLTEPTPGGLRLGHCRAATGPSGGSALTTETTATVVRRRLTLKFPCPLVDHIINFTGKSAAGASV